VPKALLQIAKMARAFVRHHCAMQAVRTVERRRQLEVFDFRSRVTQRGRVRLEHLLLRRLGEVPHGRAHECELERVRRQKHAGIDGAGGGDDGREQRGVADVPREHSRVVERRPRIERAMVRHGAVARLVAHDAAKSRGPDNRAVGLRAERAGRHPARDRGRRSHRRAAGGVLRVPRIAGFAGRVIRELRRDGFTQHNRAGALERLHAFGGFRRGRSGSVNRRTIFRRRAVDLDDVLYRDGRAFQRPRMG
jgi:hypothetical protein